MSSMGIGSWLSRYIEKNLLEAFIVLQLAIALIGGFSAMVLFYAFGVIDNYTPFLFLSTILIGTMLGIEIPLIIRILKDYFSLKTNVSNVFTMDYIGALIAALLFPMIFVPKLGLMQTGLFFGLLNAFVALMCWVIFKEELSKKLLLYILMTGALLGSGFYFLGRYSAFIEHRLYSDDIIFSKHTPYQNLIVTRNGPRYRLYINGALQFDSLDEYRYHEMLIHPAMIATRSHENVLIIGGGDGLGLREVLKYDDVLHVTLVDLDPAMTTLFTTNPQLCELNRNAFKDKRVEVINADAWKFLETSQTLYDVIIIDLPDPNNISLSRLYSETFYRLAKDHLSFDGAMVAQSTSPLYAREAFWSIVNTVEASGLHVMPYHVYVPSFGVWGYTLAQRHNIVLKPERLSSDVKFIDKQQLDSMRVFPADMQELNVSTNTLQHHPLLKYYNDGWEYWYE